MPVHFMQFGMTACNEPDVPGRWPPGHTWSSDWENVTCAVCLKGKGEVRTFELNTHKAGGNSFTCLRCKQTTWNAKDIKHHYCPRCHVFHDDIWPPARAWWLAHPDKHTRWET